MMVLTGTGTVGGGKFPVSLLLLSNDQAGADDVPVGPDLSQLSHGLPGRHRTRPEGLDIEWTLTCGYGFCRTGWTCGIDLRIPKAVPATCP